MPPVSARARAHHVPLHASPTIQAPRAGVLLDAGAPLPRLSPRYAPLRRGRRDLPRVFAPSLETRPGESAPGEYPARYLPLDYRQPAEGVEPLEARLSSVIERRWRRESPISRRSSASESAPRPEFALPDEAPSPSRPPSAAPSVDERSYGASVVSQATGGYAIYEAYGSPAKETAQRPARGVGAVLRRKVLNTERYNNGARRRGSRAQRAAVRALLAFSGAFYALSLLAFYFLSLA